MKNKTAIVLGGTVPHCELIRQLKTRGYYTVLIDYLDDSPAKEIADEHVQESTLDKEAVLKEAKKRNAELIVSGCVDQANVTACYVMEKMGLKPPYSYGAAMRAANKTTMKQGMMNCGVLTSKYLVVGDYGELDDNLRFPLMVKPSDSNSANGVKEVSNKEELKRAVEEALSISRDGQAIIEEVVTGQEISAYCVIKDHKAKLLMTAERLSVQDGSDKVIKCYATIAPAHIEKDNEIEAEEIASRLADEFEIDNSLLFFQGIIDKDGNINVIEFAPRTGGGSCFKTIKGNTGFDVISATIDSWTGNTVDLKTWHYPSGIYVVNTVYGRDGVYKKITGADELIDTDVIEDILHIRMPGDRLDGKRASSSRVCFFIVKADSEKEMISKIETAYTKLDVLSEEGESLIRKDLSLSKILKNEK